MATLSVPASLEQLANVNAFIHETIPSSYRPLIPQVELDEKKEEKRPGSPAFSVP